MPILPDYQWSRTPGYGPGAAENRKKAPRTMEIVDCFVDSIRIEGFRSLRNYFFQVGLHGPDFRSAGFAN